MKNVIASAGMLALGAVVAQSVRADMPATPEKPWTISGTLRGFYDDNYNTQPNGNARKGSFGIEVRPQATYGYSSGPTTFTASYTYSERYFAQRPGNKSDQSHDLEISLQHAFNERYSASLQESFVVAQEPEVIDSAITFPLRANGDNFRNYASLNFDAEVTPLLGFVVGYQNTWYDYTGNTFTPATPFSPGGISYGNLLNRIEQSAVLSSRWHFTEDTVGTLNYQFNAVNYTQNGSIFVGQDVAPNTRNNISHIISVGAEHAFRSDLSVSAKAGIQISDYYNTDKLPAGLNNGSPSSIGPFADLSATYAYMESGKFTLGFRQSKNQTDQSALPGAFVTDQESSTLYVQVDQTLTPISPRLAAHLQGQYQVSRFNGTGTASSENATDTFYLVGLNLTYQFNRFWSAEAGYNYDLLQSDIPFRGYDRNRVYLGVTATY